jgi:hypothetical protein
LLRRYGSLRDLAPQPIGKKRKECVLLNWGCVVSGTTRDLNRMCLHKTLRAAQGGASLSAKALTAADTHLL